MRTCDVLCIAVIFNVGNHGVVNLIPDMNKLVALSVSDQSKLAFYGNRPIVLEVCKISELYVCDITYCI